MSYFPSKYSVRKETSISWDTECILFEIPVNGVLANPNIYKNMKFENQRSWFGQKK